MKKAILLSFLIMMFSCSNDHDDDFDNLTNNSVTSSEGPDLKTFTLSISQTDASGSTTCQEIGDSSFLVKNNSLLSGALGKYGNLEKSSDNSITVYSCVLSSTKENDFITQRFGGIFTTSNGESINLEGRLGINRKTHQVHGSITINNIKSNDSNTYAMTGDINKSGSCLIQSYPQR